MVQGSQTKLKEFEKDFSRLKTLAGGEKGLCAINNSTYSSIRLNHLAFSYENCCSSRFILPALLLQPPMSTQPPALLHLPALTALTHPGHQCQCSVFRGVSAP